VSSTPHATPDPGQAKAAGPAGIPASGAGRHRRSLRLKLSLTYAGMALLTAVILGGIMVAVLGTYYSRAEGSYLRAAGQILASDPPPLTTTAELSQWARSAALATSTRVRVLSGDGTLIADSGSPSRLSADELLRLGGGEPGHHGYEGSLPQPLGGGLFGGSGARSARSLSLPISGANGAYVQISEAPASGRNALISAVQAWILAAALAVALAALAGWVVAARIARPVVALTAASDRMAEGDLGARAQVDRADEVGRLAESFNAMAGRIQGTVTTLRRFVADAAHEIGTPLTALRADLELAQRTSASPQEQHYVERALEQAQRLEALSTSLLQLSRLEAGDAAEAGQVDAAQLARQAADAIASKAEQAGVELRLDIAAGPLPVRASTAELQTVLSNLLDNAVKFTREGGTVTLSAQPAGPGPSQAAPAHAGPAPALLTVADTGVGIPEAEQAEIFERFHRARNVSAYPGNGLGLAIVKAAVERSGGTVTFTSSEAGTEFRVKLPSA
jgi:two-component system sensor histidine kinase BaeS